LGFLKPAAVADRLDPVSAAQPWVNERNTGTQGKPGEVVASHQPQVRAGRLHRVAKISTRVSPQITMPDTGT